ncbi:RNA-binding protein [Candidatus Gracilibacteria bacterium CG17_big_fil_post_rev_8_21_14_2_50_48_13]|nr:MAG: RNA-binding protein [Candidatus Gracilibacteria bacterium CG17_big_fil_post_rev_8_21_14_2_50_48_13]
MNTVLMRLNTEPYDQILSGAKTIELRLYDEKRRELAVGDMLIFEKRDHDEQIAAQIIALHRASSFYELLQVVDPIACGWKVGESVDPAIMEKYYSPLDITKYGVLGIEVQVLSR